MFKDKFILTIDDSDTIRSYLRSVLTPLGAKVEGAASGQEGLKKCANKSYHLILLDLILPDADGIEILQRIRETNSTSAIVMLTGHGGIKSAITAAQLGADGYLQKQEMTATARDHSEFLYALEQALDHRAGIVAQEQLETMRADFYSMVTHDLRSPASTIKAALDMMFEDSIGPLNESQAELLNVARQGSIKLIQLINDYLDYAKIDAGYLRLDRKQIDLAEVMEDSAQLSILQANARQQTLTLDFPTEPVPAMVDAERLKQVLDNLLSNASKYTPEGGHITLQLREENGYAVFRVSDTGVGIAKEQMPALFTKYHRLPGVEKRAIPGTGLGLIIVKEIVNAHAGGIEIESEGIPGKGTTFIVRIPLTPPAIEPTAEVFTTITPVKDSLTASDAENEELYQEFMRESRKQILTLHEMFRHLHDVPSEPQILENAWHISHTLRGNAGAMQLTSIHELASQIDTVLRRAVRGEIALTPDDITELAQRLDQIGVATATE